jgi:2,3-diketo-5-methylthio-1-phosphopentane phosphatase
VLTVGSVLVDFDGTVCRHDVAEHLLIEFGDPRWSEYDAAWERGELDARTMLLAQAAMLRVPDDDLVAYALEHCPIDPTFAPFVAWCDERDVPLTLVSDGFGIYIEPLLRAVGLGRIPVRTNRWQRQADDRLAFPHGHPECIGCGTCKMLAVQQAPGPVVFVGDGSSDRYGALHADLVFAKDALVGWCDRDGVPAVIWDDFDDVRATLEDLAEAPGPVAPPRCPGWTVP